MASEQFPSDEQIKAMITVPEKLDKIADAIAELKSAVLTVTGVNEDDDDDDDDDDDQVTSEMRKALFGADAKLYRNFSIELLEYFQTIHESQVKPIAVKIATKLKIPKDALLSGLSRFVWLSSTSGEIELFCNMDYFGLYCQDRESSLKFSDCVDCTIDFFRSDSFFIRTKCDKGSFSPLDKLPFYGAVYFYEDAKKKWQPCDKNPERFARKTGKYWKLIYNHLPTSVLVGFTVVATYELLITRLLKPFFKSTFEAIPGNKVCAFVNSLTRFHSFVRSIIHLLTAHCTPTHSLTHLLN